MNHAMRIGRRLAPIAAAGLLLTGCGIGDAIGDKVAEEGVEKMIEEAAEADATGDVDVDLDLGSDGGGITIEGEDGGISMDADGDGFTMEGADGEEDFSFSTGEGMPEGFPSDDVPLVDGDVVAGGRQHDGDTQVWQVSVKASGSADEAFQQAVARLEGAGFGSENETRTQGLVAASLTAAPYQVHLSVIEADGTLVNYMVQQGK